MSPTLSVAMVPSEAQVHAAGQVGDQVVTGPTLLKR
jgi:hypothetical protein